MNFGTILNSVTKTCVALMVEGRGQESKTKVRDFIRYVKIKEVLNRQFRVYHQLNSSYIKDKDSAKLFVNECLSTLDKFDFNDILSYNHILESRFDIPKMKSTEINLDISRLVRHKTSAKPTDTLGYIDALTRVVEHVNTVREEKDALSSLNDQMANSEIKFLQPKHVVRIALKKFNDRYTSNFSKEDREVFNTLREGNQEKIEDLYSDLCGKLILEFEMFDVGEDRELADKLNEALGSVTTGYTQANLLNAYELCSELSAIRKDLENGNG